MMNSAWNLSGNPMASEIFRRLVVLVFLALSFVRLPAGIRAADQSSGPLLFASKNQTWNDIEIEAKIRRSLHQDAQLRPLNLGVHMNGGVANLSGPVPSAELKQRAIALAERIDGVLAVSGKDLYVSTSEQPGKRMSVVIQEERPMQTRAASPGSRTGGAVALQLNPDSRSESATTKTAPQITLLAPERAGPPLREPESGRLTANPHPASPTMSISIALEQLRRRDARFQQIRTRVQGTSVYVYPSDATSEDVMTFAQAIRRISGVQHVVLSSNPR